MLPLLDIVKPVAPTRSPRSAWNVESGIELTCTDVPLSPRTNVREFSLAREHREREDEAGVNAKSDQAEACAVTYDVRSALMYTGKWTAVSYPERSHCISR